jgi:predicted permease
MRWTRVLRLRLRSLFRRNRVEHELDEELRYHFDRQVEENLAVGMSPDDARYSALRDMQGLERRKEECREMRRVNLLENLAQDLRYGLRQLRANPGFSTVAVLTLALGIGANTAIFTVINAVLLRKQPYPNPSQLVALFQSLPAAGEVRLGASPPEYLDYRDRNRAFASIAGYSSADFDLTGEGEPERIKATRATHNLFTTLGIPPMLGRTFSEAEDHFGAPRVAVISHAWWQRRYSGNPRVLGTRITLDERLYTIVGVMPPGFEFPASPASAGEPPALWVPMAYSRQEIEDRAASFDTSMVARLKPNVGLAQALGDLTRVVADFERDHADIYTGNIRVQPSIEPLGESATSRVRPVLLTLAGAVGFVLLIACVNVANLLLARAATRQREMAVRGALGASAGRLVRQLLTETALLTFFGGALGWLLARTITTLAGQLMPEYATHPDMQVLGFTLALCTLTCLLCGLAPALDAPKQVGRQIGVSRGRQRFRNGLMILEAGSAVVLVVGAGLLIHSFMQVLRVPAGFDPDNVMVVRTTFNWQRYPQPDRRHNAERMIVDRLASLQGVASVALTTHLPLADRREIGFILEGHDSHDTHWAANALVSEDYFAVMGIRLIRGRTFNAQDTPQAPMAAIVNETMARRYWPGQDPVGQHIRWAGRPLTIVGEVGDVHTKALDSAVEPTIYSSVYQIESGATKYAVFILRARTAGLGGLAAAARKAIWSVDSGLPVFGTYSLRELVAQSLATRRFAMILLAVFAALALLLAVIGLYGVLSYAVAQRTQEMGLRLALGAAPGQLARLVIGDGLRLAVAGVAVGLLAGALVATAMSKLLF